MGYKWYYQKSENTTHIIGENMGIVLSKSHLLSLNEKRIESSNGQTIWVDIS